MFASVWQLLSAIFFISALTKVVYKLIKQANDAHHHHSGSRQLRGGTLAPGPAPDVEQAAAPFEPEVAAGQQAPVVEEEQQRQFGEENELGDSLDGRRATREQQHRLQLERQLQRQRFRRQVRAVAADELQQVVAPLAAALNSNSNHPALDGRRQNVSNQQQFDLARTTPPAPAEHSKSSGKQHNVATGQQQRFHHTQRGGATNKQQQTVSGQSAKQSSTSRAVASFCAIILIETFFLEPLKFFAQLLANSLRLFCTILDAIEGIEPSADESANDDQLDLAQSRQETVSKRLLARASRLGVSVQSIGGQQRQATARRGPNYFDRRYRSRRSLSAALLDEEYDD